MRGPTTRRRIAATLAAALLAGGLVAVVAPAAQAGGDASAMVSMANGERSERGLPKYSVSGELASVAASWAAKMAKSGDLAHNPSLRSQVGNYRWVGENVGYGADAAQIHGALMKSPAHRANILDRDYTQIGVGTARDSKGVLWIAQVFRQPMTSAPAPKPSPKPTAKAAPKPAPKPAPKATEVSTAGRSQNAAAPKPAARPAARPAPRPSAPPRPTFAEKLAEANAWADAADGDPLSSTLAFARAMESLTS